MLEITASLGAKSHETESGNIVHVSVHRPHFSDNLDRSIAWSQERFESAVSQTVQGQSKSLYFKLEPRRHLTA